MCSSPWVSAAVQALFELPNVGLALLQTALGSLILAVSASYVIICAPQMSKPQRLVKLMIVNLLAVANAVIISQWLHECTVERTQWMASTTGVLSLACFVLIYLQTKSRALAWFPVVLLAMYIPTQLLGMAFPVDIEARLESHMQFQEDSDMEPHWSIVLRWIILDIRPLAVRYMVGHAVFNHAALGSQKSQLPTCMPPSVTSLAPLQQRGAKWIWMSGLIALMACLWPSWPVWQMLNEPKPRSAPGSTRELLGTYTAEEVGTWFPIQGSACIALLALMVLSGAKRHLHDDADAQGVKRACSDAPDTAAIKIKPGATKGTAANSPSQQSKNTAAQIRIFVRQLVIPFFRFLSCPYESLQ